MENIGLGYDIEETTKRINLKKLCRYIDKWNSDFSQINMKELIDKIMTWDRDRQIIFTSFFIQNKRRKDIMIEWTYSGWKVDKELKMSVKLISECEEILS